MWDKKEPDPNPVVDLSFLDLDVDAQVSGALKGDYNKNYKIFTKDQTEILNNFWLKSGTPDRHQKKELAKLLNCTTVKVGKWFWDRKEKEKGKKRKR